MTVRKFDKMLKKAGWHVVSDNKHRKYKHDDKPNHICIPTHDKELHTGMCKRLLKEAGLR